MKINHVDHVNIVVRDLDAAIVFFEKIGFKKNADKELSGEWIDKVVGLSGAKARFASMELEDGQTVVELLTYYEPQNEAPQTKGLANESGYRHIGIDVDDIDAWHKKLVDEGIECFSEVQEVPNYKNKRLFYFRGPEGIIVEFMQFS